MSEPNQESKTALWFQRALLLAIVLGSAVAMSPNITGPDLWGHVQYGRDAIADGEFAPTTTYSYTAAGYRWVNHENFAELLMAIGADTIGPVGLVMAKFVLSLLLLGLIVWQAFRDGAKLVTVCLVAMLVATNMAFHWAVRPQLFSYIYFTLLVVLLSYCFHGWQGNWHLPRFGPGFERDEDQDSNYCAGRLRLLWLAPILFLFWANSHGGFVAGYCLYVAYLVCRTVEVLMQRGWDGMGIVRRFALMIFVAGLATLVNPYGPGLPLWLLESLGTPRPEITEWAAPNMFALENVELWLIIALFGTAMAFSKRSRDFTHLVLLTLTLWQSLEHQRHIPFFAILFGFWMPVHIESCFRRWRVSQEEGQFGGQMSPLMRRMLIGGLCLSYLVLGARLYERLTDLKVDRARYPVTAMQYIADHNLQGRMVVTYNWAQYVIGAFGTRSPEEPGIQVAFDGRFRTCYPQEIVDMSFDLTLGDRGSKWRWRSSQSPAFDGGRILEFRRPDLVLLSRGQPHSQQVMKENLDEWALLYQDNIAQLWGRRAKYDDRQSVYYIPPAQRRISDEIQKGYVTWPALPVRGRRDVQLVSD